MSFVAAIGAQNQHFVGLFGSHELVVYELSNILVENVLFTVGEHFKFIKRDLNLLVTKLIAQRYQLVLKGVAAAVFAQYERVFIKSDILGVHYFVSFFVF